MLSVLTCHRSLSNSPSLPCIICFDCSCLGCLVPHTCVFQCLLDPSLCSPNRFLSKTGLPCLLQESQASKVDGLILFFMLLNVLDWHCHHCSQGVFLLVQTVCSTSRGPAAVYSYLRVREPETVILREQPSPSHRG